MWVLLTQQRKSPEPDWIPATGVLPLCAFPDQKVPAHPTEGVRPTAAGQPIQ